MNEVEQLKVLQEHIKVLEERIQLLEAPVVDNAARNMALMTVLRACIQCSGNQPAIAQMCDNMYAMIQAQPGTLLGDKKIFEAMKQHAAWMLKPAAPLT